MSITTIYKVSVDFSYEVTDFINEYYKDAYALARDEAIRGNSHAGSDTYTYTTEWAEFDTMQKAIECDKRLHALRRMIETIMATRAKEKPSDPD